MEMILTLPLVIGFLVTFFSAYHWIKRAESSGLTGKDMNKHEGEQVAEAGGISVILGFVIGVLAYVGIQTFYFNSDKVGTEIFAIMITLLSIAFMGFTDDILGWKVGLNKKTRLIFIFLSAIPLMVINAGQSEVIGINLGILYPLLAIPLGILCASVSYNTIAGYNGLETRQGIILLLGLLIASYANKNPWVSFVALIMIVCLFGFYIFNKYPSKVFPGNVLTYAIGSLIAMIAISGNIEKIAVFFFIPYIIEVILKSRGKLKKESFAKVNPDGSLEMPYDKIYGLEHLAIYLLKKIKKSKKAYEKEVVMLINTFQALIILTGFIIFKVDILGFFRSVFG